MASACFVLICPPSHWPPHPLHPSYWDLALLPNQLPPLSPHTYPSIPLCPCTAFALKISSSLVIFSFLVS